MKAYLALVVAAFVATTVSVSSNPLFLNCNGYQGDFSLTIIKSLTKFSTCRLLARSPKNICLRLRIDYTKSMDQEWATSTDLLRDKLRD